jgi:uncharacterized repeat protein (TIGR01451 family)
MNPRRLLPTAVVLAGVGLLASACGPTPAPASTTTIPTSSTTTIPTSSTTTSSTSTTLAPRPASVEVVLSQLSPGTGTTVISGQAAPLGYLLTVTNSGDEPSGPVVVIDTVSAPTTLVADSVSCGATPDCTVAVDGATATWTLGDVTPGASHALTFAATVDQQLAGRTSVTNTASFTNVATPGCATPTCTTGPVTNAAEEFRFVSGAINPRNVVFYSGLNTFRPVGWTTTDPAATITLEWSCVPDYLCVIADRVDDRVTFDFPWDEFENTNFRMTLKGTATQGGRTVTRTQHMDFNIIRSSSFPWS